MHSKHAHTLSRLIPEHCGVVEDAFPLYAHDVVDHVERARLEAQGAGHERAGALI